MAKRKVMGNGPLAPQLPHVEAERLRSIQLENPRFDHFSQCTTYMILERKEAASFCNRLFSTDKRFLEWGRIAHKYQPMVFTYFYFYRTDIS